MKTVIGEFKGKPTLSILRKEGDKFPFTFGISKAKLIVEHIEDIKDFVDSTNEPVMVASDLFEEKSLI